MIEAKHPINSLGQFNLWDSCVDNRTRSAEVNMQRQTTHLQSVSPECPFSCIIWYLPVEATRQ